MVHFRIFTMSQSEKARKLKAILSSILNEDYENEEEKPGPSRVKEGLRSACVCTMFTLHTCMDIRRKLRF